MRSNTLYLECYSGISGDMTVAALLDLGASREVLEKALDSLAIEGFQVRIRRVKKSGLDACDFEVILDEMHENHDHDMRYLHAGDEEHAGYDGHARHDGDAGHDGDAEHAGYVGHAGHAGHAGYAGYAGDAEHDGDDGHAGDAEHAGDDGHAEHDGYAGDDGYARHDGHTGYDEHAGHNHVHLHRSKQRGIAEIIGIINQADITDRAKTLAIRMFTIIADAEAKAHGVEVNQVHFHEVGAVDSIVDIVAVAVCIDDLGIKEVIVPELYEGCGFVQCQHGTIPIPVPAVVNIAAAHHLVLRMTGTQGELITPTGAAIAAAIKTSDQLPEKFVIDRIGIGAGKRTYDRPSLLRAMLIKGTKSKKIFNQEEFDQDEIYKLESNIDDSTGELLGYVLERLLEAGARDVHYIPVYMKKNRPAYQLNVICKGEDLARLERIIFEETTTIGIRHIKMERTILKREIRKIQTILGEVQVKVCEMESKKSMYPEYDSIVSIARKHHMSYAEVFCLVQKECEALNSNITND